MQKLCIVIAIPTNATIKQKSAWSKVGTAILNGMLIRKKCRCGSGGFCLAHHKDYDKPLDVEFECYKCHRGRHHLEHLAFLGDNPWDILETDTEKSVLVETAWDECIRAIESRGSIKGTLQTSII